jgi:hypothetical protein
MLKKLTAGAATGFLLLGAAGVAMAQEEPPTFPDLVVFSVQTTQNIEADVAVGDSCADAVAAIRAAKLRQQQVNVVQETFLVFVFTRVGVGQGAATLVCAPAGTEPPEGPPPTDGEQPPA